MKGILKGIGFFLLYIFLMMFFQTLASVGFMGIAAAKGCRDEQLLMEAANNNILGTTVISGIFITLVFFLIFKIRKADIKKEWKLQKPDRTLLILSVIVSFSYSLLFSLLTYDNSFENSLMIHNSAEYYSSIFPCLGIIMMVINLIVIAPVSEETALRGIVFTRAEKTANPIAAIVVSSLLFGLMHVTAGGVLLVLGAFIMGAVFSLIFYKTNSLPACFIAHASANLPDFIFYTHPQLSGGLMLLLEIISGAVFILSVFLLLRKSDDRYVDKWGMNMEYLETPFGNVIILVDDIEYPHKIIKKVPNEKYCPDIVGRYHIIVDFVPDGFEHEIKCIIPGITYTDRGPESGEMRECQAFYKNGKWKLSIAVECETGYLPNGSKWSDRYDYDANYLENGMSYLILKETKETQFTFGVAWIDDVEDNYSRDAQTHLAADVTME